MQSLPLNYMVEQWEGTLVGRWAFGSPDATTISVFEGSQILQSLYNFGDFGFERTQSLFKDVSDSFTNYMRSNPGLNATNDPFRMQAGVSGTVFRDRTCLVVRWHWLTLPAALVCLTLLFFVVVLFEQRTALHGVRTWMSSPLPLMLFGPDRGLLETSAPLLGARQELEGIEQLARQIKVGLVTEAGGDTRREARGTCR